MPGASSVPVHEVQRNRQVSLCQILHLTEENIRFVLLAIFLYIYLCIGAFMFQALEEQAENQMRENYETLYTGFRRNLSLLNAEDDEMSEEGEIPNPITITEDDLLQLLYAYGNATKAGAFARKRWDWVGSFHFAWTIVSTIGYGATTPTTTAGQLLIIPYGFFGCAGGLLFFNLFLERIITFLASSMRYYRIQRQKRRSYACGEDDVWNGRRSSQSSADNNSAAEESDWKPSVYWVMLCLLIMSAVVIFGSAAMFHSMEGWTIVESIYFAFVSYATIGFGDFVALQKVSYDTVELIYRVGAFTTMVLGCCCIYSLLNVTSIVIKQSLNLIIRKMDCTCCTCCRCLSTTLRRKFSSRRTTKRGRMNGGSGRSRTQLAVVKLNNTLGESSGLGHQNSIDMEDRERRFSGENMISLRGELNNKVSLAVMQKRLYETAQMSRSPHMTNHEDEYSVHSVGPLAIVTEKLT